MYIDIVYQFNGDPYKAIYHERWIQDTEGDYDGFSLDEDSPAEVSDGGADHLHPDIVYSTYMEIVEIPPFIYTIEHLFVTYERLASGNRNIRVASNDGTASGEWDALEVSDGNDGAWFPRIDVGIDLFDNENVNYLVGVVYHTYDTTVDVYYTYKILNTSSPSWIDPKEIDNISGSQERHCGVPYIDIDPIEVYVPDETIPVYAHIVWSRFTVESGNDIEPFYTNSYMIRWNYDPVSINNSAGSTKEGLPVITMFPDRSGDFDGTVEFIIQSGSTYPVWSKNWELTGGSPIAPDFTTEDAVQISAGYSSGAGPPWIHGPSSADFGDYDVLCAWTEWEDGDNKPDITYDYLSNSP